VFADGMVASRLAVVADSRRLRCAGRQVKAARRVNVPVQWAGVTCWHLLAKCV